MPELPEVQTIVNQLHDRLVGLKIDDVEILRAGSFFGDVKSITGAKITSVHRRAKIILIHLDNGLTIAVHLKMTGQLVFAEYENKINKTNQANKVNKNKDAFVAETVSFTQGIVSVGFSLPNKSTRVVFHLRDGQRLFFNDMRQFGWVKVLNVAELQKIDDKHGPEPFEKGFTLEYFQKIVKGWNRSIKLLLMDQQKIAGIGNIYANEALWYSRINPQKKGRELEGEKVAELFKAIKMVLEMGIKYQGASDNTYINALGEKGSMQEHFMVYGKHSTPCQKCGEKILRITIGGRGTFYCPKCQR